MDNEIASNAWKSINNMLIQNRCWICCHIFQKGKKKKVFMISQILQVFKEIHENKNDERVKILTAFINEAPHVTLCWQSFQYLNGDNKKLSDALYNSDVQVWISGLACCRNDLCSAIYNSLFSNNGREEQIASILSLKGTFVKSAICPPGCDCGWQFISVSRPDTQLENIQLDLLPDSNNNTTNNTNTFNFNMNKHAFIPPQTTSTSITTTTATTSSSSSSTTANEEKKEEIIIVGDEKESKEEQVEEVKEQDSSL